MQPTQQPEAAVDLVKAAAFLPDKVQLNTMTADRMRTFAAVVAGVAAGIFGLTGLTGVAFFFAAGIVTSQVIPIASCPNGAASCFPNGGSDLLSFGTLFSGVLTYVLMWMIVYDFIYVF